MHIAGYQLGVSVPTVCCVSVVVCLQVRGVSVELSNHHSASRVIQWCLKEGSPADRSQLLGEVKANIVELSKSKYGRHVVQKIISMASKEEVPGRG